MRRACVMALLLLWICSAACAQNMEAISEKVDFSGVQAVLDEQNEGFDAQKLFEAIFSGNGEFSGEALFAEVSEALSGAADAVKGYAAGILAPLVIWAIVSNLLPDANAGRGKYAYFAAGVSLVLSLIRLFLFVLDHSKTAMRLIGALTDRLTPVLVSLLALTGGTRASSLITPMGALASRLIAYLIDHFAFALTGMMAALAAANAIGGMKLRRLEAFAKSLHKWLLATMVGVYIALMATGGLIAGAYDGALLKGAKYAADSLLPIVGSQISGTMDSIAAGAQLVRSAAGITGLAALLFVSLRPMLLALLCRWGLMLLAAVFEPAADDDMLKMLESFSGVFSALLAVLAAGFALSMILIGAAVGMGARVLG